MISSGSHSVDAIARYVSNGAMVKIVLSIRKYRHLSVMLSVSPNQAVRAELQFFDCDLDYLSKISLPHTQALKYPLTIVLVCQHSKKVKTKPALNVLRSHRHLYRCRYSIHPNLASRTPIGAEQCRVRRRPPLLCRRS